MSHVARVPPERVSAEFTFLRALEMALVGVFLGNANAVQIEMVVVGLRCPDNGFVSPGEPLRAVQAVTERPDHPASDFHSKATEDGNEDAVERYDFSGIDPVSHLPADRTVRAEDAIAFVDDRRLKVYVGV